MPYQKKRFLWPMVLEHDNLRLNAILDEELSDTHSHINAATDVFEFNWLRLMNMPGRKKDKGTFLDIKCKERLRPHKQSE